VISQDQYVWSEDWIRASSTPLIQAKFKHQPDDFCVEESLVFELSGEGEHLYLYVEKTNTNTRDVQTDLARIYQVPLVDVGYAGMKDRHAVCRQWFSVRLPKTEAIGSFTNGSVRVLKQAYHTKKLRIGDVAINHFRILLRDVTSEPNIDALRKVPNYFGAQRFGKQGQNLKNALRKKDWIRGRKQRFLKGIYLSSLRAYLFNAVLAERVKQDTWSSLQEGEPSGENLPTGPLWGRGRLQTTELVGELEQNIGDSHAPITEILEWSGLNQERRSLICETDNLKVATDGSHLTLEFDLLSGCYATTVLHEIVQPECLGMVTQNLSLA